MPRIPQPQGKKGSLKWIQRAVNDRPDILNAAIRSAINAPVKIEWRSPLTNEEFTEYRDEAFLECLGLVELAELLRAYWPKGGPQWDALARTDDGGVLLVEAKAHIDEICSPPTLASGAAREQIVAALQETASVTHAAPRAAWESCFYQITNRLAHLHFLRNAGVPARLVLVNFLHDKDMKGPTSVAEWQSAYRVVWHVRGLPKKHRLAKYVIEVYPDVRELTG